jgi:superfamily I DNA and/or RNA helicase
MSSLTHKAPPSVMLNTQYRMHPAISAFPNKRFYNVELRDGTVSAGGKVRPDLVAPRTAFLPTDENGSPRNLSFVDHDNPEEPNMGSIQNTGEANIVASIVMDLLIQNPVSYRFNWAFRTYQ